MKRDLGKCGWLMSLADQGDPESWERLDGLLKLFKGSQKRNGMYLMRDKVFGRVNINRNPSPGKGLHSTSRPMAKHQGNRVYSRWEH
jgi:hypothetical protein